MCCNTLLCTGESLIALTLMRHYFKYHCLLPKDTHSVHFASLQYIQVDRWFKTTPTLKNGNYRSGPSCSKAD